MAKDINKASTRADTTKPRPATQLLAPIEYHFRKQIEWEDEKGREFDSTFELDDADYMRRNYSEE